MSKSLNTDANKKEFWKKFVIDVFSGETSKKIGGRVDEDIDPKIYWNWTDQSLQEAYKKGYRAGRKITHKKLEAWITEGIPKQNK